MKKSLEQIRHVLEEHLSAINDNTTEIQVLFDYLQEVETKVDSLSQRLDKLQLDQPAEKVGIIPLSKVETDIFLILYTEESALSAEEISVKTKLPLAAIMESISFLIKKNIPVHRSFFNQQFFFALDAQFKEIQAKENVINLSLQNFM